MNLQRSVQYFAETNILTLNKKAKDGSYKETGIRWNVSDIDALHNFCNDLPKHYDINKGTYKICFGTDIIVRDTDTNSIIGQTQGDRFSFILSTTDNLLYVEDIKNFFKDVDPYESAGADILSPIYLISFNGVNVRWKPLSDKQTVVDKNLRQIWPVKTGEIPPILLNALGQNHIEK